MSRQDKSEEQSKKQARFDKKPDRGFEKPAQGKADATAVIASGRIAKILARAGVASRREVERMIEEGRVKLDGKVLTSPAVNVSITDKIEVDDKPIGTIERTRLWLYHKPAGLVTTNNDPEGRTTVFEKLPDDLPRVLSIGRLDINTEGLLLLTNDGGLARTLELPSTGWLRRYRVRAHGRITQEQLDALQDGIAVEGVLYGAIEAKLDREQGSNVWITMGLREGKNREIKVVLGALGLDVNRLIRLSYGPFQLGELGEGKVLEVKGRMLRDQLGPRLTEESGANFDAPLREHETKEQQQKAAEWKPRKKLSESERKERARDRISTRPDDGPRRGFDGPKGKEFGAKGKFSDMDDKPKRPMGPRNRAANVWMGTGARPTVEKPDKDETAARGRQPKTGNWHRPKDKLDPQKNFRRPKSGDKSTDDKGHGKSTDTKSKSSGGSYIANATKNKPSSKAKPIKRGKDDADRRR